MRDRMSVRGPLRSADRADARVGRAQLPPRLADRLQRWIVGALFPYPARLRIALAPLKLIERAGLRPFLERSMPRSAARMDRAVAAAGGAGSRN